MGQIVRRWTAEMECSSAPCCLTNLTSWQKGEICTSERNFGRELMLWTLGELIWGSLIR